MKVAVNVRNLKEGHDKRGIGSYTKNLIHSLRDRNISIIEFENLEELKSADIVHYPNFDFFKASLPIIKRYPSVITIHDTIPLIFPEFYPSGVRGKINFLRQKFSLKSVDAIITDSKSSKKDIEEKLGIKEDKIFSVFLAPSKEFKVIRDKKKLDEVSKKYSLPKDFLIYYGDINWNKNLSGIAEACSSLRVNLVMVGSNFKTAILNHYELDSYKKFLDRFKNDPFIHLRDFMPIEDLVCTVNLAKISLLASYYEGFGLPIVESQACGTPVITSSISSMIEVGGKGAVFVNPYSINSIKDGIEKILSNPKFSEKNSIEGLKNVKRFSWQKCAEETVEVYKYVLGN